MNIETLNDHVRLFKEQVTDSGFRRDVTDYVASLPNVEDNIVGLREIARNVLAQLQKIHQGDLPEALQKLFPTGTPTPFTENKYNEQLESLLNDKTVQQDKFYRGLHDQLERLNTDLATNAEEVDRIAKFVKPFTEKQRIELQDEAKAVFSIIFKDQQTTHELDEFSKQMVRWNRILPLYHQLVTNTSPEGVEILEVQNGSIDLVIHLDVKAAIGLAELFKVGFLAYSAYLAHKKILLPIAAGYFGNPKLLELDQKKEQVLLENIGESVSQTAKRQHEEASSAGAKVDNSGKVIEQVSSLVTLHIIRGNDVKILALPNVANDGDGEAQARQKDSQDLREASATARSAVKELPAADIALLLKQYGEAESTNEEFLPEEKKPRPRKSSREPRGD